MKAIAKLTGFRDEQAMRRAFLQQLAMTPRNIGSASAPSWRAICMQAATPLFRAACCHEETQPSEPS
jgi:transcriptional regulator GlxA family with amidase domain